MAAAGRVARVGVAASVLRDPRGPRARSQPSQSAPAGARAAPPGELGDAATVELAEREVTLHRDGRRRRLPACRRCASGVVVQLGGRVYHVGVR